jgi:hypothetical protein
MALISLPIILAVESMNQVSSASKLIEAKSRKLLNEEDLENETLSSMANLVTAILIGSALTFLEVNDMKSAAYTLLSIYIASCLIYLVCFYWVASNE